MLADAGVPVIVHCGHGPVPGAFTGLDVFAEVLERHPKLVAVLARAGQPEIGMALDLDARYPGVYLDTTMVGVDFAGARDVLPADWVPRLVDVADRVVLAAVAGWAAADDRLGAPFLRAVLHDAPARLLGCGTSV